MTLSQAAPGIATAPSAIGTGTPGGTTVTDTAALAGGYNPTGTIEFQLYGPSAAANCTTTAVFDKTVAVSGNGGYTSPSFTPGQAGTYWWTASYGGDNANNSVASGCGAKVGDDRQQGLLVYATAASAGGRGKQRDGDGHRHPVGRLQPHQGRSSSSCTAPARPAANCTTGGV